MSNISCSSVDLEADPTLTQDRLVRLVGKKMDAKWEVFATHLRVERNVREGIHSEFLGNVTRCFSEVTGRWLSGEEGTGDFPRTWDTVFGALRRTGQPGLVHDIQDALTKNQVNYLRTHTLTRTHTHTHREEGKNFLFIEYTYGTCPFASQSINIMIFNATVQP